jgi:DNA invertase Pin-like site-specific DNA recombinase
MSHTPNRAATYTRISYDPRAERLGVERQAEDADVLAVARGLSIVEHLEDNDTSASGKVRRPGFERLLQLIEARAVDVVVAWSFDRLTRNRRDTVRFIEAAQEAGILLLLVRGSDLDMSTPAGRLTADILASVARNEIEVKSDRQKRANVQRATRGRKPNGGRRSFGYDLDMSVRWDEADMVAKGYEWFLSGVALKEIARRWNDAGFTTPQATRRRDDREPGPSPWAGDTVRRCLMKPLYAGLLTYRGADYGTGTWTPLVNVETWSDAQAIFKDPSRKPVHGKQKLLSGVAMCGVCETHTVNAGGGRTGLGVYACSGPVKHLTRRRDHIDEFVRAHVIERLSLPDAADLFVPDDPGARRAITARLSEIDDKLDGLAGLYARGILTERSVEKQSLELREERTELEAQLHTTDPILAQGRALATADDIETAWDALPTDIQRQLIDRLMVVWIDRPVRGSRRFDPATVRIDWRA